MLKNIFYALLMKGGNLLIPFFTYPYLVRVLSPDGYGAIGYGLALFQYLNQMSDYSLPLTSTKSLITSTSDIERSKIFSVSLSVKVINIIVFSALSLYFAGPDLIYISIVFVCASIFNAMTLNWYFQSRENLKIISLISIIPRLIQAVFIFIFITEPGDVISLSFSYLAVSIVSGLICLFIVFYKDKIRVVRVSVVDIMRFYTQGFNTFIGLSCVMLYTLCTPIIITYLSGTEAAGLYLSIDKIKVAAVGIIVIAGQAIYPRICNVMRTSERDAISLFLKVFSVQAMIGFFISLALYYYAEEIIEIVLGEQYRSMIGPFAILSWTVFFISCSFACNTYFILPFGYDSIYRNIPLISGVLHLAILFLYMPKYGLNTAIYSVFLIEFSAMILCVVVSFLLCKKIWRDTE
ncbi:oligosaccharide flippase family protein [Aeromonas veronii]|uniref:oligosaccharide flippase family protein n=1 Tax=Aeromonas veronii TaxID=654 RepID=UPI003D24782A